MGTHIHPFATMPNTPGIAVLDTLLVTGEQLDFTQKSCPAVSDARVSAPSGSASLVQCYISPAPFISPDALPASREGRQLRLTFGSANISPELQWLGKNFSALGNFAGEWVVLTADGILAHDSDYLVVRSLAVAAGITTPLIFRVPKSEQTVFMGF